MSQQFPYNPGKAISVLRQLKEIEQQDLAEQIGVAPNYLSMIEHGKRTPSLDTLGKIGDAFGLPVWAIFLVADRVQHHTAGILPALQDIRRVEPMLVRFASADKVKES